MGAAIFCVGVKIQCFQRIVNNKFKESNYFTRQMATLNQLQTH